MVWTGRFRMGQSSRLGGYMQECGGCTACCHAFPVAELNKPIYTKCEHADKGCKIYKDRPQSCKDCFCSWVTQPKVHPELRPDKCGVIFEKRSETEIHATLLREPTDLALGQMHNYELEQGCKVLIYDGCKLYNGSK